MPGAAIAAVSSRRGGVAGRNGEVGPTLAARRNLLSRRVQPGQVGYGVMQVGSSLIAGVNFGPPPPELGTHTCERTADNYRGHRVSG